MIDFARANPGKLSIGIAEVHSMVHVGLMALCQMEKLTVNFIPFFGAAPTMMAVLGGHVMVGGSGASVFARQVRAKQVRLLGLFSGERLEEYPGIPTFKELGYPGLVIGGGYVILGHQDLDKSVSAKLQGAFKKAMETPGFIKIATEAGIYDKKILIGDELKADLTEKYHRNEKLVKGDRGEGRQVQVGPAGHLRQEALQGPRGGGSVLEVRPADQQGHGQPGNRLFQDYIQ